MKILIVLTSHDKLGNTGQKTGFWLEELAAPYYVFTDAGAQLTLASQKGGQPPLDPKSDHADAQTAATLRFRADQQALSALANTHQLSTIAASGYDAIFYPGGHGPLWDLVSDVHSITLIEQMLKLQRLVAAVCHASIVLLNAKDEQGQPIVKNRSVTGFSNSEEAVVQLTEVVPCLLEDALMAAGAHYSKKADWQPYVVSDGLLITGQNPASSVQTAQAVLTQLQSTR